MDIFDNESPQIGSFLTALDELSNTIQKALQNRTSHLNGEKYLTNKDVCRMLHVSTRTLQDWRNTGKIPFIRIKGKILYRDLEILRLLQKNSKYS